MAVTIPDAQSGDNILSDRNAVGALVESSLNNIDGAAIQSATIANASLAKAKSFFPITFQFDSVAGTIAPRAEFALPNLDGASNSSWKFLGYSVCAQTNTTPNTTWDIKKNGSSMLAAAVNFSTLTAGVPTVNLEASPDSLTSGDVVGLEFTYTAGTISNVTFVLFFSVSHVGT